MKYPVKNLFYTITVLAGMLIPTVSRAVSVSTYVVDGVYNNPNVVVYNRNPVFSVEYTGKIVTFAVAVSTYIAGSSTQTFIWIGFASTDAVTNTQNLGTKYRTSMAYGGGTQVVPAPPLPLQPLSANTTYYWGMILYNLDGSTSTAPPDGATSLPQFYTVVSSVSFAAPSAAFDLVVDWNNPFNPNMGGENGKTKFRYFSKDERSALVRIFTLSGEYVATAKHFAPSDGDYYTTLSGQTYTAEWDGRDYQGNVVSAGVYLVNLSFQGEAKGVTKRVVVIKK